MKDFFFFFHAASAVGVYITVEMLTLVSHEINGNKIDNRAMLLSHMAKMSLCLRPQ